MSAHIRITSADLNRITTGLIGHAFLLQQRVREARAKRGGRATKGDEVSLRTAQGYLDLKDRLMEEWDAAQPPEPRPPATWQGQDRQ